MTKKLLLTAVSALFMAACSQAEAPQDTPTPDAPPAPAETAGDNPSDAAYTRGRLIGVDGAEIGIVVMLEGPNGVLLRVNAQPGSLEPGWHGLHLHQVGDCSDIGRFTNSGGHIGKIEGGHGLFNPDGPEGGDIPNIWVAANGSAGYETLTSLTTAAELLDEDGSALIIHADEDDHASQPIGGAGPRVACAVLN